MFEIVAKEISFHGFLWTTLRLRYNDAFFKEVPDLVRQGRLKYREDRSYGLEKVGEAFLEVQTGYNCGKKVVMVTDT